MDSVNTLLTSLGQDALVFLLATVAIGPLSQKFKFSPILGFLFSGLALKQLGLFQDNTEVSKLSEIGIQFLLFEMGLELSTDRLKALSNYAFKLGTAQLVGCAAVFTAFLLPVGASTGTRILETFSGNPNSDILLNIRSVDEAVVIGLALSLSSSAFVLQLLSEKGQFNSNYGSATLGVLLLQDIAVVPLLVALPLIESTSMIGSGISWSVLIKSGLVSFLGLGIVVLVVKLGLEQLFRFISLGRSKGQGSDSFVALSILTVTGVSLVTQKLGFSDTLGAFLSGVLLAETNFRSQLEEDIRPIKGLLLGLFFVTTGAQVNLDILAANWDVALLMLVGLVSVKSLVTAAAGRAAGLSPSEAVRTGFILAQGGEFAFVVLALASQLRVLPAELNQLLIAVVILSMFLTPGLEALGVRLGELAEGYFGDGPAPGGALAPPAEEGGGSAAEGEPVHGTRGVAALPLDQLPAPKLEPVVVCGFGRGGQIVVSMLASPLYQSYDTFDESETGPGGYQPAGNFVVLDSDPEKVERAREMGFAAARADCTREGALAAAGAQRPAAAVVCLSRPRLASVEAVKALRQDFPMLTIYAQARDVTQCLELREAGATHVYTENSDASLRLGREVMAGIGVSGESVEFVSKAVRDGLEVRAREVREALEEYGPQETRKVYQDQCLDMYVYAQSSEPPRPGR